MGVASLSHNTFKELSQVCLLGFYNVYTVCFIRFISGRFGWNLKDQWGNFSSNILFCSFSSKGIFVKYRTFTWKFFPVRNVFLIKIGILVLIYKIIISLLLGLGMCWNSTKYRNTKFLPGLPTGSVLRYSRNCPTRSNQSQERQREVAWATAIHTVLPVCAHAETVILQSADKDHSASTKFTSKHASCSSEFSQEPTTQQQVVTVYTGFIPNGHH